MKRFILLLAAFMVAPIISYADSPPEVVAYMGRVGTVFKMCDAEADTTDCLDASGDEIVLDTAGFTSIAIDFSESTTTFTCEAMGNNVGHDAASGVGQDLVATSFSGSQFSQTLPVTVRYIWITCSANAGGAVTVTAFGRR